MSGDGRWVSPLRVISAIVRGAVILGRGESRGGPGFARKECIAQFKYSTREPDEGGDVPPGDAIRGAAASTAGSCGGRRGREKPTVRSRTINQGSKL